MTFSLAQPSVLANLGTLDKVCRKLMLAYLAKLQQGCIELVEDHDRQLLGDSKAQLRVTLTVVDAAFYQKLVLGGSVGAGESYIDGHWRTDNLTGLVQIFARNAALLDALESGLARLSKPALKLLNWRNRNTVSQSKKNISAHYDLGNSMYQLFLDPSMMYSSAVYPNADSTLEQAQQYKLQQICEK
ncbi:MAG: class I SAM-dependent methyltransferase, partial [Gammaproteobacteria bacterium]|nr:class I SAM-dependent methyltransferase [Gammaproteobacteria bacterium]